MLSPSNLRFGLQATLALFHKERLRHKRAKENDAPRQLGNALLITQHTHYLIVMGYSASAPKLLKPREDDKDPSSSLTQSLF